MSEKTKDCIQKLVIIIYMNKRLSKYFTFYYKNNPIYNIDYR